MLGTIPKALYGSAMYRAIAAVVGIAAFLAPPAQAQTQRPQKQPAAQTTPSQPAPTQPAPQPKRLGAVGDWVAYASAEKGGQICYVVGQPVKSEPANVKREPIHLLVTHNLGDKTTNVVSFIAGYKFKDGSDAPLAVGDKSFDLFTKDDTAWARDAATDKAVVAAMLKAKQAVIKGNSARGTATTDTYNLAGFVQVLGQIDKACNVKR
jgi:hypothetical protein